MVIDDIISLKRKELETLKSRVPFEQMERLGRKTGKSRRSLKKALSGDRSPHLICELKKASPAEGLLRKNFRPLALAKDFEAAGASAISVLTERHYFMGDPETLKRIRPITSVPLIRKDFIFDPYQVYETATLKADAFLVIAFLLKDRELTEILRLAKELDLETLVEVHAERELERALGAGAAIVGINTRNLKTLQIEPAVAEPLFRRVPKGIVTVIESGIQSAQDIARFQSFGAQSFLIGTALMKSTNVKRKILELSGWSNGAHHG